MVIKKMVKIGMIMQISQTKKLSKDKLIKLK